MNIIYGIGKAKRALKNAVLAIGVFDGLHVGHQKLIRAAVKRAKSIGGPAVVMTFSPHPVQVLCPDSYLPFVVSLPHRLGLIERLGVATCVVVRFTKRLSRLTAQQFIKRYLVDHIHPAEVFVGRDFRFGRDRGGSVECLREAGRKYGFKIRVVSPVAAGGKKIGSSRIRRLITEGKLHLAGRFLGRRVSVTGRVVRGNGRGKTLGFPTANIHPCNEVIPPVGVYAVRVAAGKRHFGGMANVGRRPSFKGKGNHVNVEVHIFDFKKTLYGKEIAVEFIKKIRDEKMFGSRKKLIAQLKRDEIRSKSILRPAR